MTRADGLKQAFLADIAANPEDDTPRLIFADWLEENGGAAGEARALFIRVQFELAGLTPPRLAKPTSVHGDQNGWRPADFETTHFYSEEEFDIGERVDLVLPRRYTDNLCQDDLVVTGKAESTHGTVWYVEHCPWPDRARYHELLRLQHGLMCHHDEGEAPWVSWAWTYEIDEDGHPLGPNGRPGMAVYPALHDQFPWVEVPPRVRQTFRKGFVERAEVRMSHAYLLKKVVRCQPIRAAAFLDKAPRTYPVLCGQYCWGLPQDDHILSGHPHMLPEWLFRRLGGVETQFWGNPVKLYRTEADGQAALSSALLSWARSDD